MTTSRMDQFEFGGEIAWRPTPEYIERSRLTAFIRKHGLRDYAELMHRSTTDLEWFWRAVLDDLGIEFYEPYRASPRHLARYRLARKWCVGGRMNIVHNCLDKWMGTADRAPGRAALGRRRRRDAHADLRAAAPGRPSLRERSAPHGHRPRRSRGALHADVPRAGRRVLRASSRSAASSCRCSPATARTRSPAGCRTLARRRSSPRTASGDAARSSR